MSNDNDAAETYRQGFMAGTEAFHYLMDLLEPLAHGSTDIDWDAVASAHAAVRHLIYRD